jgi:tetratricopeptide (TPR) repeat protein
MLFNTTNAPKSLATVVLFVALVSTRVAAFDALVGPGVGNADTLLSEGTRLFNRRQYSKAAENFMKASRANPANTAVYVQLARALNLAKDLPRACYAYRVYLKSVPESPDRKKASAESDQCERQLKSQSSAHDFTQKFVDKKAAFFAALEAKNIMNPGGASESLAGLVKDGFLGPELGEMAQKLGALAIAESEDVHKTALSGASVSVATLKSARPLYQLAHDVGASASAAKGRMAFLDGLAEFQEGNFKKAENLFEEAARLEKTSREYSFYRGLALFRSGDRQGALKVLETELPNDPRTDVLRVAQSVGHGSDSGAAELEKMLFLRRYPPQTAQ